LVVLIFGDTSPLNYLIRIGAADVLHQLYGQIIITPEVREELGVDAAPEIVRTWISNPPGWPTICSVDPVMGEICDGAYSTVAREPQSGVRTSFAGSLASQREDLGFQ
jgi:hypothetical protein